MKAKPLFRINSTFALFSISGLAIFFPINRAKGDVVLSNIDTGTFQLGSQLNLNRAVSFQTNNSGWNITNFSFAAYNPTQPLTSDFTIRLYAASLTSPYGPNGTELYSASLTGVSIPGGISNSAIVSFNTPNWIVEANTNYSISVSMDSAPKAAFWARSDGSYSPNSWTHLSDLFNNGSWAEDTNANKYAFSISATAVPEPSTIVTFSLCILGVLIWRFIGIAR